MTGVYLDHAATTPVRPEAAAAFTQTALELGNPSSVHSFGRSTRRIVDESRETIAQLLGAQPAEVIFTAGGTEADNLAILGGFEASDRPGLIVSAIEHPAVLESAHYLSDHRGADVHIAPVTAEGLIDLDHLEARLRDFGTSTGLLSLMWANNETGALQPLTQAIELAGRYDIAVHSDAVQAAGSCPIDFAASGLGALSISGHKLGAPVGIGALVAQRDFAMAPHQHGGVQERGVRSGTVNAAGARALAVALTEAARDRQQQTAHLTQLRNELQTRLVDIDPGIRIWAEHAPRLPGHLLVSIPGTRSEALLFAMDMNQIAASSGSACQAGVVGASPVVLAMGGTDEESRSALRFTLGHTSTEADIDTLVHVLPGVLERARAALGGIR